MQEIKTRASRASEPEAGKGSRPLTLTFKQDIQPSRRGVSYLIETINGPKRVQGPQLSDHFAARRDTDVNVWVVTHLPTGLIVPYADRRVLKRAKQIAFLLEQLPVKWSRRSFRFTQKDKETFRDVIKSVPQ